LQEQIEEAADGMRPVRILISVALVADGLAGSLMDLRSTLARLRGGEAARDLGVARQTLHRILAGKGTHEDLDTLLDTCDNLLGRSFCALGDGAVSPIASSIQYFRDDYEARVRQPVGATA